MSLLLSLVDGSLGVYLRVPGGWSVARNDPDTTELLDKERGVVWWLFAGRDLHLDLSDDHAQDLRDAAEHHARAMFDSVHAVDGGYDGPPRTSDLDWTPIVDFERSELQGVPVLRSIHRMIYRPGRETILGHVLIPRSWGLFEVRVAATDQQTGVRESLKVATALRDGADITSMKIPQAVIDDPAFDQTLPNHCLSRGRSALRWLMNDSGLRVEPTELPRPAAEVTIAGSGCTVRPPPRFFATNEPGLFRRASFCVTDGVELFFLQRHEAEVPRLARYATRTSREIHEGSGVHSVELHVEQHSLRDGQADVLVVIEGDGHQGRLRNVMLWRLDDRRRPWSLSLTSTAAVPRERLIAEMLAAGRSWTITG